MWLLDLLGLAETTPTPTTTPAPEDDNWLLALLGLDKTPTKPDNITSLPLLELLEAQDASKGDTVSM